METPCTQPCNCVRWFPSMRWIQTHRSIIFKPVFRNVREEVYRLLQKWRLDDDMLQQGELWVMRCEEEGPSGVHLDSKVRRVKRMNLFVKCSIKIADGKVVMFHLPSHSIAFVKLLDVRKVTKRSTTGSKEVSISKFAVEVVDKQSTKTC